MARRFGISAFALFALAWAPSAAAQESPVGSSTDLFDSTRGTVVIASDAIVDPINAFRTSGGFEDGNTLMRNGGLGSVSFIEFATAGPVGIVGVRLLAHNDSDECCLRRSMSRFVLLADRNGDAIFETTVVDVSIDPDYGQQPGNAAEDPSDLDLTLLAEGPVAARRWRLEVTQGTAFGEFEGARVIEVDALPAPPEDCTNEVDDDGDGLVDVFDRDCDADRDGVLDLADNCPPAEAQNTYNPIQENRDGDGAGDACDVCPNDADAEPPCPRDVVAESAEITSPAIEFSPGQSVPVECSFTVTGAPVTIIRPDARCLSTTISCTDEEGGQLSQTFQLPPAVGIPDDVVMLEPGDTFDVQCDLHEKFDAAELAAGPEGEREVYRCNCTFSSFHRDPDLDANGNCTVPPEEGGCVDLDVIQSTSEDFEVPIAGEPVRSAGIDIKPGSCPNHWNPGSHGVLKVAILGGGDDLDVTRIDAASLRIARADQGGGEAAPNFGPPGPKAATLVDVATPFAGAVNDCHDLEGDRQVDLRVVFRSDDVANALHMSDFAPGSLVQLVVRGELLDGTPFVASGDAVRLVPPGTPSGALAVGSDPEGAWIDAGPLDEHLDEGGFATFLRSYPQTTLVSLVASAEHAGRAFRGWSVDGGPLVPGRTLALLIANDQHGVAAIYESDNACGLGYELVFVLLPLLRLRRTRARSLAGVALVIALGLPGGPAGAQELDGDRDGFPDALEASGIPLHDGSVFPPCPIEGETERASCVDPNSPDLFVIILRADSGCDPLQDARCIPSGPAATALIARPLAEGGLGIAVHEISQAQAADDRTVSTAATQKAVRVREDRNPLVDKLGNCPSHGTPNDNAECKVFTQKIFDFVMGVCAGARTCNAATGEIEAEAVVRRYVTHTLAHEIAHSLLLSTDWTSRFGGYHEKAGAGVIMEQSSKYTNKGGRVTWYVSTEFGTPSQEAATLKLGP